jgi:hypothetical protein
MIWLAVSWAGYVLGFQWAWLLTGLPGHWLGLPWTDLAVVLCGHVLAIFSCNHRQGFMVCFGLVLGWPALDWAGSGLGFSGPSLGLVQSGPVLGCY